MKLIKRKTNTNEITQFNLSSNCSCSVDQKTGRKNSVENVVGLMKKVEEISKSYEECEKKIHLLTQKNEEITNQNQSIIHEIYKKNDYSKKLETLLFFIIEMFLPKNTLSNIINSSDEAKKYIKSEEADRINPNNNNLSGTTANLSRVCSNVEEPNPNIYANNFSESFFQNIYEKLRESLSSQRIPRSSEQTNFPMLVDNRLETAADRAESFAAPKSVPLSPNPYDEAQKLLVPPLNTLNRDEKLSFFKTPSFPADLTTSNYSFLGRKTAKCNKENNVNGNVNDIFRICKPNGNNILNITNEEEDLQRYLESNEKNEEANKISFDTNLFLDNENLFDFNNNPSNGVNMNNNVYQSQEKEFF